MPSVPRKRIRSNGWPILLAVLLPACSGDSSPPRYTAVDSAGVTVISSRAPAWDGAVEWSVGPEPRLVIGTAEGDPQYEFFRVNGVLQLYDGRVVVADEGTNELRFYDSDGMWLRTVGGEGEGPGEYRSMRTLLADVDSIWIWDLGLARTTVSTREGETVRVIPMPQGESGPPMRLAGRLADGRLILEEYVNWWGMNPVPGVQPIPTRYHLADRDGKLIQALGEFEAGVHMVRVMEEGSASMSVPFGRRSYFGVTDGGFVYGTGERFEIREFDAAGRLRRIIRRDLEPEPVRQEDFDEFIDSLVGIAGDPSARPRVLERFREIPLPPTKPTYTDVRVGARGDLWLENFRLPGKRPPRWTVFDSSGVHLGTLELPVGFDLHQVGPDFILGVRTDDLDVERVEIYPLDRACSGSMVSGC